jgi:O-antigen ligase
MNMHWNPAFLNADPDRGGMSYGLVFAGLALAASLFLGGASRTNEVQVALVELLSLPALLWAIWRLTADGGWKAHRLPIAILIAVAAIPLVQLIPMPGELWAKWPGHQAAAEGLRAAGIDLGWRPISLTPLATTGYLLALLPPVAIFLSALTLSGRERLWLTSLVVIAALVSIAIGGLQIAGGDQNPLYFYYPTNLGSAVGLFSNRNHQAALLIAALPFAALWVVMGTKSERYKIPLIVAAIAFFLVAIIGLVIVRSRAGVFMLAPALVASFVIMAMARSARNRKTLAMVGGGVVVALFLAVAFGMGPLLERFAEDQGDLRGATSATVLEASFGYLPFGSGVGSFVPVYESVEPIDTMKPAFWNHAHNDLVEVWLETGVLGVAVLAVFLLWWLASVVRIWRPAATAAGLASVPQAAVVVTTLLMVHSLVDYPLRTLALAGVFALACALMEKARTAEAADA